MARKTKAELQREVDALQKAIKYVRTVMEEERNQRREEREADDRQLRLAEEWRKNIEIDKNCMHDLLQKSKAKVGQYQKAIARLLDITSFTDPRNTILFSVCQTNPETILGDRIVSPKDGIDSMTQAELERLLMIPKKIQAIKLYRQVTGKGLLESKNAIDALQQKLGL
jgi:hypothetical protein